MAIQAQPLRLTEHVTRQGKVIKGYIIAASGQKDVIEIDPYTFRKQDGWFVREKHRQTLIDAGIGLPDDLDTGIARASDYVESTIDLITSSAISNEQDRLPDSPFVASPGEAAVSALFQERYGDEIFQKEPRFGVAGGPDVIRLTDKGTAIAHQIGTHQKFALPFGAISFLQFVKASGGIVSGDNLSQEQFRLGLALSGTQMIDRSQEMLAASLSGNDDLYYQITDRNFLMRTVPGFNPDEPRHRFSLTSLGEEYLTAGALVAEKMIEAKESELRRREELEREQEQDFTPVATDTAIDINDIDGTVASNSDYPAENESAETTIDASVSDENKEQQTQKPAPVSGGIIQDFGGHIPFAKKELASLYGRRMKDALGFNVADVPLSKSWPEPNYQGLVNEGMDPFIVGWIRAVREEVPTKPRQAWKLRSWVGQVEKLRDFCAKLVTGEMPKDELMEKLDSPEYESTRDTVGFRAEAYARLGHETSLDGMRISSGQYTLLNGVSYNPAKTFWTVERPTSKSVFGNWPKQIVTAESREEAIQSFFEFAKTADLSVEKKKRRSQENHGFSIYSQNGQPGVFISKKIGKTFPRLKTFQNAKEAYTWLQEGNNIDELLDIFQKYKDIPNERRLTNCDRIGTDHRCGSDVTPERFMATFGFYGVQFGNYVEGARRQHDLNNAYDALMDLADVLKIPPRALSLNGQLGLAFGARGSGGKNPASAHFEPAIVVINLTKTAGAGSLAHEWWHAVDNYFSRMDGVALGYLTESKKLSRTIQDGSNEYNPASVRSAILASAQKIVSSINNTKLPSRSNCLDSRRSTPYWGTTRELTARAFEAYVIYSMSENGNQNDYLANIVHEKDYSLPEGYPYPLVSEMKQIKPAYQEFFDNIKTIENDNNIAMFSRSGDMVDNSFQPTAEDIRAIAEAVKTSLKWDQDVGIEIVESWNDLPRTIKDQVIQRSAFNLAGAFHSDKIWVVAENIKNMDHALHTILHEGCHKGLSSLLGKKADDVMIQIYKSNPAIKVMADGLMNKYKDLSTAKATEECLADIAGNREWKKMPLFDKIISMTKDAIRQIQDYLPSSISSLLALDTWTYRDVVNLADKAVLSLQSSNDIKRMGLSSSATAMLSRNYDQNESIQDQINSKSWAIVRDGRIITSGNSTGMSADYLAVLARGHRADGVLLSDKSFTPGTDFSEETKHTIFGKTWDQICAIQKGGPSSMPINCQAISAEDIHHLIPVAKMDIHQIKRQIMKTDSSIEVSTKHSVAGPSI